MKKLKALLKEKRHSSLSSEFEIVELNTMLSQCISGMANNGCENFSCANSTNDGCGNHSCKGSNNTNCNVEIIMI